jgi:carbon-monoxide dehydrogenase catalytic subunit
VDNTRILTVLSQMASEGGLGDDIADIPGVGFAPEWMSEKALSIGCYFVGSGVYTIFGSAAPIANSKIVERFMSEGWEAVQRALAHIDKKRAALKLVEYDPLRYGQSGDAALLKWLEKQGEKTFNLYSAKLAEPVTS